MENVIHYQVSFVNVNNPREEFISFSVPLLPDLENALLNGEYDRYQNYISSSETKLSDEILARFKETSAQVKLRVKEVNISISVQWTGADDYKPPCRNFTVSVEYYSEPIKRNIGKISLGNDYQDIIRIQTSKQPINERKNEYSHRSQATPHIGETHAPVSMNENILLTQHNEIDTEIVILQNRPDECRIKEEVDQVASKIEFIEEIDKHADLVAAESLAQPERQVSARSEDVITTDQRSPAPSSAISHMSRPQAPSVSEPLIFNVHTKREEANNLSEETVSSIEKAVHLIVRKRALFDAYQHAHEESQHETGGVLLGKTIPDGDIPYVVVVGIIRGQYMGHRTASLNFQPETWAEIWRTIDKDPDYSNEKEWGIVGWYHTHPSFGIFLSSHDLFIHQKFFTRPDHIALVIDPIRHKHGFFHWSHQRIVRVPDNSIIEYSEQKLSDYLKFTPESLPASQIPNEYTKDGNHVQSADS